MKVLLRADASPQIGGGHVSRSLTLAEAFVRDGHVAEVVGAGVTQMAHGRGETQRGVVVRSIEAHEPILDSQTMDNGTPDLVVVDGYHFRASDFEALASSGTPYVVIDDNGTTPAMGPVAILNQNPHVSANWYTHLWGEPLLALGLPFALVRSDLLRCRRSARKAGHVFVGLGASDVARLAPSIANALVENGNDVLLSIGALANESRVQAWLGPLAGQVTVIPPRRYVEAMSSAEVAVIGAGSTMWEVAALGVPAIAVVVADNQDEVSVAAHQQGFVQRVDSRRGVDPREIARRVSRLLLDETSRREMARAGMKAVDGGGADRAVTHIVRHVAVAGGCRGR